MKYSEETKGINQGNKPREETKRKTKGRNKSNKQGKKPRE